MENPQNQQITTETNNKVKPPRKGFLSARIMIAFLLGATIYALFNMGYSLYAKELQAEQMAVAIVEEIANTDGLTLTGGIVEQGSKLGEGVDPKELANYVESKDCTTYSSDYAAYTKSYLFVTVEDVDLYGGLKYYADAKSSRIAWAALPTVVDHDCKTIDITAIQPGDRVNVYDTPRKSNEQKKFLIQRAVK